MADLNIALILRLIDQATGPARAVQERLRGIAEAQAAAGRAQIAQAREMEEAARARLDALRTDAFAVAGFAASIYALARPAVEFEAAMDRVGAVARATDAEVALLARNARDLGAATAFSAREAAEGMQFLAMAGFGVNEIVAAMPGLLDLAAAAGSDLARTSDIASNVLSGFALEAEAMGRVGDVLVNTFTSSNTSLESLGLAMSYIGPVAAAAGMELEQAAAMAGLLGNYGIQGERAGTALRAMLSRLASPADDAAEALERLGVQVSDEGGNLRDMPTILAEMDEAMRGLGSAARADLLSTIFGMEAATAAQVLLGEAGSGAMAAYIERLRETGSAASVAARMNDNARGALRNLSGAFEEVQLAIGNGFLPALSRVADAVVPVLVLISRFVEQNEALATTIAWVSFALVAFGVASVVAKAALWTMVLLWARLVFLAGALRVAVVWLVASALAPLAAMIKAAVVVAATALGAALGFAARGAIWLAVALRALAAAAARALWAALGLVARGLIWLARLAIAHPIVALLSLLAYGAVRAIIENWSGIVDYFKEKIDRISAAFDQGLISGVLATLAEMNPFVLLFDAAEGFFAYLTGWTFEDVAAALKRLAEGGVAAFARLWRAADEWFLWLTGLSFADVTSAIRAAFDIDLMAAGAAMIQSLWAGINSVLTSMVAAVQSALASIVPPWLIDAWNWVRSGGATTAEGAGGMVPSGSIDPATLDAEQRAVLDRARDWRERVHGTPPGRALGGPVRAGFLYEINERGQEFFMPNADGQVVTPARLRAAARGLGGAARDGGLRIGQIVIHAAPGMSPEDVARAVRRELERMADASGLLHDGGAYA